jgi:cytochrome c553
MCKSALSSFVVAVAIVAVAAMFGFVPANAADDIDTKAQGCGLCHGQNGEPTDPKIIPVIWGQQGNYLFKQLHDYRSGDRANAIMALIAQNIPLEDLRMLAAYFAAKSWPAHSAGTPAAPGEAIASKIAMCKACHGQNFEGGAPAPRLAGLSFEYLAATMKSYAGDERTNNGDMPKFMKALTESERDAMARYLSGL